jgi:hypothetical protein
VSPEIKKKAASPAYFTILAALTLHYIFPARFSVQLQILLGVVATVQFTSAVFVSDGDQ